MLIESPRHTPGDLAAWRELERYDNVLAARFPAGKIAHAHGVIRKFAEAGPCYASTSWGKDSTVVAHLVATSGITLPLVYVRMRVWENPDCLTVRDRFLATYGQFVDYHEYEVDGGARWWDPAFQKRAGSHVGGQFAEANRAHGGRHITGVRGEESRLRDMAMAIWGEAGPNACRPIGRWTAVDVFAYLHRYNLPIHPAYAMSYGGAKDRRWIRVSPIGGISNAHKDRADWEERYYPDIVSIGKPGVRPW